LLESWYFNRVSAVCCRSELADCQEPVHKLQLWRTGWGWGAQAILSLAITPCGILPTQSLLPSGPALWILGIRGALIRGSWEVGRLGGLCDYKLTACVGFLP
jgi:hypothetical protein